MIIHVTVEEPNAGVICDETDHCPAIEGQIEGIFLRRISQIEMLRRLQRIVVSESPTDYPEIVAVQMKVVIFPAEDADGLQNKFDSGVELQSSRLCRLDTVGHRPCRVCKVKNLWRTVGEIGGVDTRNVEIIGFKDGCGCGFDKRNVVQAGDDALVVGALTGKVGVIAGQHAGDFDIEKIVVHYALRDDGWVRFAVKAAQSAVIGFCAIRIANGRKRGDCCRSGV
eukprot:TRINITY_DN1236_c0_g1_i1.p2 TRINITY_DN1236_c0_g1~~TRINITY_DN1236_c0_g1_i1.p2  ORF type:complete len:225 (-),score=0.86 TRINITY_DN1236_c0_g1_i1:1172-1846(-)